MVKREMYLDRIRPFYDSPFVKVITGVRRCGKSTLLDQIASDLASGGIPESAITLISFEDYGNKSLLDPGELNAFIEHRIAGIERPYILLDEVQRVKGFEEVVNSLQSKQAASIFITGSNSQILSGELASLLGGRTLSFQLMPFNFREYRRFAMDELGMPADDNKMLVDFLTWGGFPLACAEKSSRTREVVLENLYSSIVLRDIILRNKINSPATLESVLDYLIANSSTTVSGNNVAKALSDMNRMVSAPTVYDYIRAITESYVISKVPRYDIRGKKALRYEEKVYVCDLGFFRLKKNRVKDEMNYVVETAVYNELISRGLRVFVGKTMQGEIDFVVESGNKRCYVQAAYLIPDERVIDREFGAYDNVHDAYPKFVVSMDPLPMSRNGIEHLSLLDFLTKPSLLRFA